MTADAAAITVKCPRWQLIKWDGDPPVSTDDPEIAKQYPSCAEIIEGGDDIPTTVIYKRTE